MFSYRYQKNAFTLIELLTIVMILGILFGFAVPAYLGTKTKLRDQEAKNALDLVQAAEKNYFVETQKYITTVSTGNTNELLGVDLPPGGFWEYTVTADNTANPKTFCAQAANAANSWAWQINQTLSGAVDCNCAGGNCTGR